jgi:hypothetical protein
MPVHHWKALTKDVNARKMSAIQDRRSLLALKEGEAQQHHDARAKLQRMGNKLARVLERRVRNYCLHADG